MTDLPTLLEKSAKVERPSAGLTEAIARAKSVLARKEALAALLKLPQTASEALDGAVCAEILCREKAPASQVEALLKNCFSGPAIGPAHAARAWLSLREGKLRKAAEDAERAVRSAPGDMSGYLVRGQVALERGQGDALSDLKKAVELSASKDADALASLADALASVGQKEEALKAAQLAQKLRPGEKEFQDLVRTLEANKEKKVLNKGS